MREQIKGAADPRLEGVLKNFWRGAGGEDRSDDKTGKRRRFYYVN